ncbi:MAG: hypothetical protein AAFV96_02230 [Pseudomonadota bacterium]
MMDDVNNRLPSPQEVEAYISEARRLRAEALRSFVLTATRGMTAKRTADDTAPRKPMGKTAAA